MHCNIVNCIKCNDEKSVIHGAIRMPCVFCNLEPVYEKIEILENKVQALQLKLKVGEVDHYHYADE